MKTVDNQAKLRPGARRALSSFEKFDDEKDPGVVVSSLASERDEDEDSIDAVAIQKAEDVAVQVSSRS